MDIAKYAAKKNKTNTKTKLKKELLKHFNMTPKEKAKQLVEKMIIYHSPDDEDYEAAKQCALIAVNEMIAEVYNISHQYTAIYDITTMSYNYEESKELKFWLNVNQEIKKL